MADNQRCRSRGRMTIKEKKEILKKVESIRTDKKVTMNYASTALNLSRSTLLSIINNKRAIEATPESEQNRYRARNQRTNPNRGKVKYSQLEEALLTWINQQQMANKRIFGSSVRNKALMIAKSLGYKDFTASNGWCDRFKKKNNLEYKKKQHVCNHRPEPGSYCADIAPEDFLVYVKDNCDSVTTKTTSEQFEIISKNLLAWVSLVESKGAKVSVALLKEMALALAGALGVESFTGSNGWIHKCQLRRMQEKYTSCQKCNTLNSSTPADLIA